MTWKCFGCGVRFKERSHLTLHHRLEAYCLGDHLEEVERRRIENEGLTHTNLARGAGMETYPSQSSEETTLPPRLAEARERRRRTDPPMGRGLSSE